MKTIKAIVILCGFSVLYFSCEEKQEEYPLLSVHSFINYSENTVLHYTGDSIIYNSFTQQRDSVHFEYKDTLVSVDTVGEQLAYQFERYLKHPTSSEYLYQKNYTLSKNSAGVIRVMDMHNDYILPAQIGIYSKWNGNKYQLGEEQVYSILSISEELINNSSKKVLSILRKKESNLIAEEASEEKYAESVGLLYKYDKNVTLDINSGEIKSGSIVILAFKP